MESLAKTVLTGRLYQKRRKNAEISRCPGFEEEEISVVSKSKANFSTGEVGGRAFPLIDFAGGGWRAAEPKSAEEGNSVSSSSSRIGPFR